MRASLVAATSAIFGALAAVLAVLPLSFPFPLIPYLRFEVAEIPVVIAFLGFGPLPGIVSALTYWGVLTLVGEFTPIGPAMKFLAVASMLLGLWVGFKLSKNSYRLGLTLGFLFGSLLRVLTMTAANYVILLYLFPEFLDYAIQALSASLGIQFGCLGTAFTLILIFTAVFNVLHMMLSLFPSLFLLNCMVKDGLFLNFKKPWIRSILRKG